MPRTGGFVLKLRWVSSRWKPTVTPIRVSSVHDQEDRDVAPVQRSPQSCQHTIPSAMNGSAVIVPVAILSAVSFLTG